MRPIPHLPTGKIRQWNRDMNLKTKKRVLGITALVVAAVIWQIVAEYVVGRSFILPSVTDVAIAFVDLFESGTLLADITASLEHFGIGLIAALLLGVPIGILMGWFRVADFLLDPIIEILRPIPPLAWIPFAIIWFGLTTQAAGFVIFAGVLPDLDRDVLRVPERPEGLRRGGQGARVRHFVRTDPSRRPSRRPPGYRLRHQNRHGRRVDVSCRRRDVRRLKRMVSATSSGITTTSTRCPKSSSYMLILGIIGLVIDRIFRNYVDAAAPALACRGGGLEWARVTYKGRQQGIPERKTAQRRRHYPRTSTSRSATKSSSAWSARRGAERLRFCGSSPGLRRRPPGA
jgi:NitT/TauT family transport system permease protein